MLKRWISLAIRKHDVGSVRSLALYVAFAFRLVKLGVAGWALISPFWRLSRYELTRINPD